MTAISLRCLLVFAIVLLLSACGGGQTGSDVSQLATPAALPEGSIATEPAAALSSLPADGLQPWETLDANGYAQSPVRSSSSINLNTDFRPGVERFLESGDALDNLEATRLNGTDSSGSSYAMYRVSMGSAQPGIVSVDANLRSGSGYYVGLSNYGTSRWDWQGPFTDNHVRLQAVTEASGDLTSTLGNTFVTVLSPSGSSIDVVGIGINQFDPANATAPATPLGLSATPVPGGIELSWSPVLENDLAGYAIYYADMSFVAPTAAGVQRVSYLEGGTRHILSGLKNATFVAISAIDFGGNESAVSGIVSAVPLAAAPVAISLQTDRVSGMLNDSISLTASGASAYDWDLDGDGVFEIENDNAGSQSADTSATGLIRPRVRGRDGSGTYVALGGLSLIISGNSRPVASALATPTTGAVLLDVELSGIGEDLEDAAAALTFAWDLDGDGIYEEDTDSGNIELTYNVPSLYNVKFRVTDTQGAWDVDTLSILATGDDPNNLAPMATYTTAQVTFASPFVFIFDASASSDPDGTVVLYEWDFTNDGSYDERGPAPVAQHAFLDNSENYVSLRITDDKGKSTVITTFLRLPSVWPCASGNPRGSSYSQLIGPQAPNVRYSVQTSNTLIQGQPVFGPDGTLYLCGADYELMAIDPQTGAEKWKLPGTSYFTPAVAANGSICYGNSDDDLRCVSSAGLLQWEVSGLAAQMGSIVIDLHGNVYTGRNDFKLHKFSQDGILQWSHLLGDLPRQGFVLDYNGTVYATVDSGMVTAIRSDGSLLWQYDSEAPVNSKAILDTAGNLYVASDRLHAINPDGTNKWIFGSPMGGDSTVSADLYGNIIYTNGAGTLYSVSAAGVENWHTDLGEVNFGQAVTDLAGNIYVSSLVSGQIAAFSSSGANLWGFILGFSTYSGPCIGPDGALYLCDDEGGLSAFQH
jgi:hypothetical protein